MAIKCTVCSGDGCWRCLNAGYLLKAPDGHNGECNHYVNAPEGTECDCGAIRKNNRWDGPFIFDTVDDEARAMGFDSVEEYEAECEAYNEAMLDWEMEEEHFRPEYDRDYYGEP